ncbi:hypothetical protein IQ238_13140 [Pleurocapsales cyanobacterium LEGE 06147]|nr:hypothetical protein [Pleurocapsales cyanobacterium LEGE 06147]
MPTDNLQTTPPPRTLQLSPNDKPSYLITKNNLTEIEVDSLQWHEWLKETFSFRYQCEYRAIALIKDRSYWTATKIVNGRVRTEVAP